MCRILLKANIRQRGVFVQDSLSMKYYCCRLCSSLRSIERNLQALSGINHPVIASQYLSYIIYNCLATGNLDIDYSVARQGLPPFTARTCFLFVDFHPSPVPHNPTATLPSLSTSTSTSSVPPRPPRRSMTTHTPPLAVKLGLRSTSAVRIPVTRVKLALSF